MSNEENFCYIVEKLTIVYIYKYRNKIIENNLYLILICQE